MNRRHGKNADELPDAWIASPQCIEASNLAWLMQRIGVDSGRKGFDSVLYRHDS